MDDTNGASDNAGFDLRLEFIGVTPDMDSEIADRIHEVGARMRSEGRPIRLAAFLHAIPWLRESDLSLDAAIAECFEHLELHEIDRAAMKLIDAHPELAPQIQRAVILRAMLESSPKGTSLEAVPSSRLPCDYGPPDCDGRPRYELRTVLGAGNQGTVYTAVDRLFSRPEAPSFVALKLAHRAPEQADETARAGEAVRARRVLHPGVVRVLDRGVGDDGREYAAFELVDGMPLDSWLKGQSGRVSIPRAVQLIADLCESVQAAHSAGLVHRDLKPSNILIDREGRPHVTDFGVARESSLPLDASNAYSSRGSLAFMAPEQFRCEPGADAPIADVYALGGLLYWLLTDEYPNGRDAGSAMERLEQDDPHPAPLSVRDLRVDVGTALDRVISRALNPQSSCRHGSAQALGDDLRTWLARRPVAWQQPGPVRRVWLLLTRHPVQSTAAIFVAALVGFMLVAVVQTRANARFNRAAWQSRLEQQELEAELEKANERVLAQRTRVADARERILAWSDILREAQQADPAEYIAVISSLEHSDLFREAAVADALLDDRIIAGRRAIAQIEARGQGQSLEAALWQGLMGTWLSRSAEHAEAIRYLKQAEATLAGLLGDEDPWLVNLRRAIQNAEQAVRDQSDADSQAP